MKSLKLTLGLMTVLFISFSFNKKNENTAEIQVSGQYGVCQYEKNNIQNYLHLTLKDDHTFQYTDKTNPEKPIETTGKWTLNKNVIVLQDYQSEFPIHSKWKVDKGTNCLKSKRGMTFYRLCNLGACTQE